MHNLHSRTGRVYVKPFIFTAAAWIAATVTALGRALCEVEANLMRSRPVVLTTVVRFGAIVLFKYDRIFPNQGKVIDLKIVVY